MMKNIYRTVIVVIALLNVYFVVMYGRVSELYIIPGLITFSIGTLIVYFMPRLINSINSHLEPLYFETALAIGLLYLLWSLVVFDVIRVLISLALIIEAYLLFSSNHTKFFSKQK